MDIGRITAGAAANASVAHAASQPASPETTAQQRELIKAVRAVNATELFGQDSELTFVFDRETRRAIVRVVDKQTREVVLQVPAEYVIRMAEDRGE